MMFLEGAIVPGVRIGEVVIGTQKEKIIQKIDEAYDEWKRGDGFCIVTLKNAKLWFDEKGELQQIAVTKGFRGRYNSIGIGSTMKDIVNRYGSYEQDGDVYLISEIEGICFELGDTDDEDDWNELEAPIEWICVYRV